MNVVLVIALIIGVSLNFLPRRYATPVTGSGLQKYDHLPPEYAIYKAWTTPGNESRWNQRRKQDVYDGMPLLARALDRLVEDWEKPL